MHACQVFGVRRVCLTFVAEYCKLHMLKIWHLPVEVLENIFLNVDGQSLAKAQQVCHYWLDVIQCLQTVKNIWRRCCVREIAKEVIEELIGNRTIPDYDGCSEQEDIINWKTVYQKWFCGSRVKHWACWKKQFVTFDANPISCVKLSGECIVTGHRNGSICAWNSYTGELLEVVGQHLSVVSDILLVDLLHEGHYGEGRYKCRHHHIISVSTDHLIHLSPLIRMNHKVNNKLTIEHHSDSLTSVRLFDNIFVVGSMDNTVTVWQLIPPSEVQESVDIVFKKEIHGPAHICNWIGFWKDEIYCLCQNGMLEVYSIQKDDWISSKPPIFLRNLLSSFKHPFEQYVIISNAVVYRKKTVFLLCADTRMCVSVGDSEYLYHQPMRQLQSYVICTALCGSLLAIGTEKGALYLYNINSPERLKHLDLSKPSWCETLSEASIISVDISFDNCVPCVVATTTDRIFFIYWFSQQTHQEKLIKGIDIY